MIAAVDCKSALLAINVHRIRQRKKWSECGTLDENANKHSMICFCKRLAEFTAFIRFLCVCARDQARFFSLLMRQTLCLNSEMFMKFMFCPRTNLCFLFVVTRFFPCQHFVVVVRLRHEIYNNSWKRFRNNIQNKTKQIMKWLTICFSFSSYRSKAKEEALVEFRQEKKKPHSTRSYTRHVCILVHHIKRVAHKRLLFFLSHQRFPFIDSTKCILFSLACFTLFMQFQLYNFSI